MSGAPDGTTETWPSCGARVGAADGAVLEGGSVGSADGVGAAVAEGTSVGLGTGDGVAESAKAGVTLARRAVQVSARALRVVRRMDTLSFVGPPVLPYAAGG
ncbi:hypothetical protein GCM10018780_35670 [Streptomyces lanatus]|nr:hypothetical protein GCM10018780_35670 [Streptomyces lanatus]